MDLPPCPPDCQSWELGLRNILVWISFGSSVPFCNEKVGEGPGLPPLIVTQFSLSLEEGPARLGGGRSACESCSIRGTHLGALGPPFSLKIHEHWVKVKASVSIYFLPCGLATGTSSSGGPGERIHWRSFVQNLPMGWREKKLGPDSSPSRMQIHGRDQGGLSLLFLVIFP